jgi:DNA-directed RNA polymerase subunit RPC12/RpoP
MSGMSEQRLTHICKNCGAKVIYHPHEGTKHFDSVPVINCPICGSIIPELGGATIIAFFRKPKGKTV